MFRTLRYRVSRGPQCSLDTATRLGAFDRRWLRATVPTGHQGDLTLTPASEDEGMQYCAVHPAAPRASAPSTERSRFIGQRHRQTPDHVCRRLIVTNDLRVSWGGSWDHVPVPQIVRGWGSESPTPTSPHIETRQVTPHGSPRPVTARRSHRASTRATWPAGTAPLRRRVSGNSTVATPEYKIPPTSSMYGRQERTATTELCPIPSGDSDPDRSSTSPVRCAQHPSTSGGVGGMSQGHAL